MTEGEVFVHRRPTFCSECGQPLQERTIHKVAFDVYTGAKVKLGDEYRLECPDGHTFWAIDSTWHELPR